jgi:hypothetical protein
MKRSSATNLTRGLEKSKQNSGKVIFTDERIWRIQWVSDYFARM